jgi:23S rRNA (adenine2503-C2)-methyltransferase
MPPTPILFKDHTATELHTALAPLGATPRLARRLQSAIVRLGANAVPTALTETSSALLERIREATQVPRLTLREKRTSPTDGFTKYLFQGEGPQLFETVRIPLLHRPGDEKYIVCVSSQVGCALGCVFCATGRMGFQRNLATWEIVDQVLQVRADSPYPVRGVVFMGMGEPMLNYERVMRAAEVLSEPCGGAINSRAITVSTVGVVPMIRRYTAERRPYRLIVSLSAATSELRRKLLPVENVHPLPELMAAIREHQEATGTRVTLAWTMLAGINTRPEDARPGRANCRAADQDRPDRRQRCDGRVRQAGRRRTPGLPRRADAGAGHADRVALQRWAGCAWRLRDAGGAAGRGAGRGSVIALSC